MEAPGTISPYIIVAYYENEAPYVPKKEMEADMVEKLEKMGFEPYQIRILFERFRPGKLMLEMENVMLSSQLQRKGSTYQKLMNIFLEKYHIDFKNLFQTHKAKGVKDLQQYVAYLKKANIKWTYLKVYDEGSKLKIGSLYHDEPIPKRMIE